ncbi:MAG: hypothetical protein ACYDBT_02685 [Desulfobulbaceae bacterium]
MPSATAKYFIPLGENCQLGSALDYYGYMESSLLKWANISSDKLLNAFTTRFSQIYDDQFADVLFRPPNGKAGIIGNKNNIVLPRNGGWGSYEDYMRILEKFDSEQLFNTALSDKERGFTHGIRINHSQLKIMKKSEIMSKNQEKINYLKEKMLRAICDDRYELVFLRAQRNINQKIIRNLNQIYEAINSLRTFSRFELYIITVDRQYTQLKAKLNDYIKIIEFETFSPPSNPTLIQYSYPEWKRLFLQLNIPVQNNSKEKKYFSGFDD